MVNLSIELPDRFLEEEVRCGYTVTRNMKEVWAVELDLAQTLIDVCKRNDIKLMTFAGTTLGAVRHNGFIPWDDDIDFIVSRKDYDKLCNIAIKEFTYPYFFQTEYTDPGTIRRHAQLRNSNTTGILNNGEKYLDFNQGIFIDIFPIDNIPDDVKEFERLKARAKRCKKVYSVISACSKRYKLSSYSTNYIKKGVKFRLNSLIKGFKLNKNNMLVEKFYRKYESIMSSYDNIKTEKCGPITFMPDEKRFFFTMKSIEQTILMPFEFLEFPVPAGYEEQLRNAYGDYNQYVIGSSVHGQVFFDTSNSYTKYVR